MTSAEIASARKQERTKFDSFRPAAKVIAAAVERMTGRVPVATQVKKPEPKVRKAPPPYMIPSDLAYKAGLTYRRQ